MVSIKINFDQFNNVIMPTYILAKRNGDKIGILPAKNIEFKDSLNSYSEISFKVYKSNCSGTIWSSLTNLKLMFCPEYNAWFELSFDINEDGSIIKTVNAKSLGEAELSQINLYDIEINTETDIQREDYVPTVLYDDEHANASLLNRILEKAPHYKVAHVDDSIASIQRTFQFNDTSIYDALQDISEEVHCLISIRCRSTSDQFLLREIYVYDLESYCYDCGTRGTFLDTCNNCGGHNIKPGYGEDTTIFVNSENLADEITLTTDVGSIKNCFRLEAGDDLMTATIRNCSPNGTGYIWHFSDQMKADMSEELAAAITQYDTNYAYYQSNYECPISAISIADYNTLVNKYSRYNDGLIQIETPIIGYSNLMNALYGTIDFKLYLENELMPSSGMQDTAAATEAERLISSLSVVAVSNLASCSIQTATNAVQALAKAIIDSRYQVKTKNETYSNNVWTGQFVITNYSDDTDTETTEPISVLVNDDYESYVRQKIEIALNKNSERSLDIDGLFKLSNDDFSNELKKYGLTRLSSFYDSARSAIDILIQQGIADRDTWADSNPDLYTDLYMPYYQKVGLLESEISLRESEVETIRNLQDNIINCRNNIQSQLDFNAYVGTELWEELSSFRRDDVYSNDNYISDGLTTAELFSKANEFIGLAQKDIAIASIESHSINAPLKNLLAMPEFSPIVDYFEVGNFIRIRVDDAIYKLRLLEFTIHYDDIANIDVDFSDVEKSNSYISNIEDILSQASSIASSYNATKRQASQGKNSHNILSNWVDNGLSLTTMKIVDAADNQNITWDEHGLLSREYLNQEGTYDDRQLKIINRGIYITDDGWETSKVGLGDFYFYNPQTKQYENAYGLIADTISGNLVLAKNVGIYTEGNSISINEDGINVTDGATSVIINPEDQSGVFRISGNGNDVLWVDKNGNAHFVGSIVIGSGSTVDVGGTTQSLVDVLEGSIESVSTQYYVSDSANTPTGGSWVSVFPANQPDGTFLWVRDVYTYVSGDVTYGEPVCTEGVPGADGQPGTDGESPITIQIESSNGNIFYRTGLQTTLSCHVYDGRAEITNTIPQNKFDWHKKNNDGTEDTDWYSSNIHTGPTLIIDNDDIFNRAIFICNVTLDD